ncbi:MULTISPECIES: SemiSWEET transporter [unclassified Mesorhizobium]|uniref:SemiSWEET family sugar transporter n=1 Tax=unclassified Mesorhizobium TaxID=325217 RepID=UPI001FEE076F|nr:MULTISPECIES: SemiSWEET transporter [unclassified Mesorhizobium]
MNKTARRRFDCMETETLVGYVAALCSMVSFAPQAWKIIKTRDTGSISAPMYAITVVGFAFWLIFGFMKGEWPIIITNAACFALSAFILLMTVLPRAKKDAVADVLDAAATRNER